MFWINRQAYWGTALVETFQPDVSHKEVIKGIFQPFELGGVTRLIRSAVKFWKAGN
jgi:hypothetical protein